MKDSVRGTVNGALLAVGCFVAFVLMTGGLRTEQDTVCTETVLMSTASQRCTLVEKKMIGPWVWSSSEKTVRKPTMIPVTGVYR